MLYHRMPSLLMIYCLALLSSSGSARAADEEWTNYIPPGYVKALLNVDGSLWIGTGFGGIKLLDKADRRLRDIPKGPETYHSNRISSLAMDQSGAVWVGNSRGVSRYRGGEWSVFDANNSPLPEAPLAVLAYNPRRGCICIGTQQGLLEYDGQHFTLFNEANSGLTFNDIDMLEVDRQGRTWIARGHRDPGTPHFARQNTDGNWQAVLVPDIPTNPQRGVIAFEAARDGRLWYSVFGKGLYSYDEGDTDSRLHRQEHVGAIVSGSDGSIFIIVGDKVLRFVDNEWQAAAELPAGSPSERISALLLENNRPTWLGSNEAVLGVAGAEAERFPISGPDLDFGAIYDFASTANGDVWAACANGLYRHRDESWKQFTSDYPLLNGSNDFRGLAPAGESSVWSVARTAGFFRFDGESWEVFDKLNIGKDLRHSRDCEVDHSGNVWIATEQSGFNRFDGETLRSFSRLDGSGFEGARISSLAVASDGSVWAADSFDGLGAFTDGAWRWMTAGNSDLPFNELSNVYAGLDGDVWLVFRGQPGIYRFDGQSFEHLNKSNSGFAGEYATAFAAAPDGTIWIGSAAGLYRRRDGHWRRFNEQNSGLPHNHVQVLFIDHAGSLWIGTEHAGLARFRESTNVNVAESGPATPHSGMSILTYPNPARNRLVLQLNRLNIELRGLRLYDAAGRMVPLPDAFDATAARLHRPEFDISHLRAGRYFLVAETGAGSSSASFVVR